MPVKWTSENDHILLLKILETHNITVNAAKIAAAWPGDADSKPTPRAISERLFKLRHLNGSTSGKLTVSSVGTSSSAPSTPRKPRTPAQAESNGSRKRKRVSDEDTIEPDPDAEDISAEAAAPVKKSSSPAKSVQGVKKEFDEIPLADLDMIEQESPSKRVRKQPPRLNMVVYQDESDEGNLNSSGTEFVPEEGASPVGQENKIKAEDDDWA
ncbi:hypothetical protein VTN96DRAFT_9078 [Rasamsonia emersonii]